MVDWNFMFLNKNVHEQVSILNTTLMNIFSIEYNMREIFLGKSYTKCAGETIPRSLSKKSKLSIYLDQQCKVLNRLSLLYANLRAIEIVKSSCRPLAFTFLKKQKAVWNQFLCLFFFIIFKGKYFSWDVLSTDQISFSGFL